VCKQRLLFSGRHIFNVDQKGQEQRNNLFTSKQRDFVTAQTKSQGKKRKPRIQIIICHFIVYITQKEKKASFEFLGGWNRKPVHSHFQGNLVKLHASCPLQRRESPYLTELLFFIPKLLLAQCVSVLQSEDITTSSVPQSISVCSFQLQLHCKWLDDG